MEGFPNNALTLLSSMFLISAATYYYLKKRKSTRWRNRRWWVRPINVQRKLLGDFDNLFQEIKEDSDVFFRYTRMSVPVFDELLHMLRPYLVKISHRAPILPEQRLAITLRYLATGDQIFSIALAYRVGESTARQIVKETCNIIRQVLGPQYLATPTEQKWKHISRGFLRKWNIPNCLGAIDGKHISIQAPPNSGALFLNYKKNFSVVLMAACDHNYCFTLTDVGAYGSENDAGVLARSWIGDGLDLGTLNIPMVPGLLPGVQERCNYYFVTDSAFKMTTNMMRPYAGRFLNEQRRIFNYRLSRARRTIENAFGILASRWRVLRGTICAFPDTANAIVLATLCLHNFLKGKNDVANEEYGAYCPLNFIDREDHEGNLILGEWRNEGVNLQDIAQLPPHRAAQAAYAMRDQLSAYFLTAEGQVPWQREHVRRGFNA